jgi:DNA-binding CsgD family transcriptional regulator
VEKVSAVTALLSVALELAAAINRVTPAGDDPAEDLAFMWDPMKRLVPFAAGWIGTLDGDQRCYTTVTSVGHDQMSRAYMESEELTELRKRMGLLQRRRPLRLQDAPPHTVELPCWSEHWWPSGFREGLAVPLVTADGRHLGILGLHTDTASQPTAEARDAMGAIAHTVTAVLDPMNSLAGLARLIHGATAAVVVDCRGAITPLPGLTTDPLLTRCPDIVPTAVGGLTDGVRYTAFLCPVRADDGCERYVRVTGLACPPGTSEDLVGLVVISPSDDLCSLTLRELVVLGLVIEGRTNQGIAACLFITARTAAAHLEHIRTKLRAPTRTAAAVLAMRRGLYIPYRLIDVRTGTSRVATVSNGR